MVDTLTLSALLEDFVKAQPGQLERDETPEEWVASMWMTKNPAGKLKKALDAFLLVFADDDSPAADRIRAVVEPLTK